MERDDDSLLARHLRILRAGDAVSALAPPDRREAEYAAALPLRPLALGQRRRPWTRRVAKPALLAMAAGVALCFWMLPQPGARTAPKGGDRVVLYWERDGRAEAWQPGTRLKAGDRVRVEVTAARRMHAYTQVLADGGVPLLSSDSVLASAQPIAAGQATALPGSFQLDDSPQNEVLVVLLCDEPLVSAGELQDAWRAKPAACDIHRFNLR